MRTDTDNLFLVYKSAAGETHEQPAADLTEAGTLIDPEDGTDMELIGFYVGRSASA